jgi:xeroderma pigmentosum group C-complementing protein
MAGRKRASASRTSARTSVRRSTRTTPSRGGGDIYREMLNDAGVRVTGPQTAEVEEPSPKRRKRPGERTARTTQALKPKLDTFAPPLSRSSDEDDEDIQFEDVGIPVPTIQTIYRDSDEEAEDDEDEDNLQFEDVDFSFPNLDPKKTESEEAPKEIHLDLSARASAVLKKNLDRRKPINKSEKDRRIEIHKTHILCLLSHVVRRNRWCNDDRVQRSLRKLLTKEMIKYLNPGTDLTQFGRTNSLKTGLQKVETLFRTNYQITERGIRRALWADNEAQLKEVDTIHVPNISTLCSHHLSIVFQKMPSPHWNCQTSAKQRKLSKGRAM